MSAYDRFAGAALAEEAELVAHYKGVELVEDLDNKGQPRRDEFGNVKKKQRGQSLLFKEFGIRKQLLDDLYVRFFRLAEERIGEAAQHGIVSYISNSSYLSGRSHPRMRRSLVMNFHRVWIDNLNGDKFKTGKVVPKGLPGAGTADQSAFTTDHDPRGIQPGTALVTLLKLPTPEATAVYYRDFWGLANLKRTSLIASLPAGGPKGSACPTYVVISPGKENRWRLSPHAQEPGYESWPGIDELFPVAIQGVNHNRGVENTVIDYDKKTLNHRIQQYIEAGSFAKAADLAPAMTEDFASYDPKEVWKWLHQSGFSAMKVLPFLTFPLDQRWIYYETEGKVLNRPRPEFQTNLADNEFLITVPEPRKVSETRPLYSTTLVNLHVHERGSVVIPRETRAEGLLADRDANLPEKTWRFFRGHFSFKGERRDEDARQLTGRLLRIVLAILHSPAYQADHRSALSADWAHLPIPRDAKLFDQIATAGDQVAHLLDANTDSREQVLSIIGEERAAKLAQLSKEDGMPIKPADFKVTVNYWGGSKGGWRSREFTAEEDPMPAWGDRTGDLYIGDGVFFANVPEVVWKYELGGYPVLKKWLGYRQADRRSDEPLTTDERRWFKSMVQRIAALIALGSELDKLYSGASEDALTAKELGLREDEPGEVAALGTPKEPVQAISMVPKPMLKSPKPAPKTKKAASKPVKKVTGKKK